MKSLRISQQRRLFKKQIPDLESELKINAALCYNTRENSVYISFFAFISYLGNISITIGGMDIASFLW